MSFFRKALWVGTGGASGMVMHANSKKERIAKAEDAQLKLQRQQAKRGDAPTILTTSALDDLTKAAALHDQGVLPDEQFEAIKMRLLVQIAAEEAQVGETDRAAAEKQERKDRAAAAGAAKGQALAEALAKRMAFTSPIGPTARRERRAARAKARQEKLDTERQADCVG